MRDLLLSILLLLLIPTLTSAAKWTIMVVTSDIPGAGTSARVFVDISGTMGYLPKLPLGNRHPRGTTQYFPVEMMIGIPYQLKVWHDNSMNEPEWHLERILLINHKTWQTFMFVCRNWLSRQRSLSKFLSVKGHLYIPGRREKSIAIVTENHQFDVIVDDIMGRAAISFSTVNTTGLVESLLVTIETTHVFNGKDMFTITVIPQNLPETCEHTPSCLCYERVSKNMTGVEELKQLVTQLKKELTVDKKKTSVNLRRYISAKDDRPSSQAIGSVGAILLVVPVALVILSDLMNLLKTKKKRPRIKYSLAKTNHSPCHMPPPKYTVSDGKNDRDCLTDKEQHYLEQSTSSDQTDNNSPSSARTYINNASYPYADASSPSWMDTKNTTFA